MDAEPSEWTTDTIYAHFGAVLAERDLRYQQRFDAQGLALTAALTAAERAVQSALLAAEKATDKAEKAQELRNEVANEFRATIADQATRLPTREEVNSRLDALSKDIATSSSRLDRLEGSATGRTSLAATVVAVIGAVVGIVTVAVAILVATR